MQERAHSIDFYSGIFWLETYLMICLYFEEMANKNHTPARAIPLMKAVSKKEDCQEKRSDIKAANGTPRTVAEVSPEKMMLTARIFAQDLRFVRQQIKQWTSIQDGKMQASF